MSFHVFRGNGQALVDDGKRGIEVLVLDFIVNSWLPFVGSLSSEKLREHE